MASSQVFERHTMLTTESVAPLLPLPLQSLAQETISNLEKAILCL